MARHGINRKAQDLRRATAKERQAASDKLTPQQRLARLDSVLGPGKGAAKERAKLAAKLEPKAEKPKKETRR